MLQRLTILVQGVILVEISYKYLVEIRRLAQRSVAVGMSPTKP